MKKEKDSFFNKWNRLIKNMDIKKCSITSSKEKFEEEFEDELVAVSDGFRTGIDIMGIDIAEYLDKYFPCTSKSLRPIPIKVKIKKGKIVIERIEE